MNPKQARDQIRTLEVVIDNLAKDLGRGIITYEQFDVSVADIEKRIERLEEICEQ